MVLAHAGPSRTWIQPIFHQTMPPFQDNAFPPNAEMSNLEFFLGIILTCLTNSFFFFFLIFPKPTSPLVL